MESIAERYRLEMPPVKLYKYRSIDRQGRTEHIFRKSKLYFASPLTLNDPFDCRFRVEFSGSNEARRRFLGRYLTNRPSVSRRQCEALIEKGMSGFYGKDRRFHHVIRQEEFVTKILGQHSLLCLTEKPDDILMWSHYADCHRGICLEFTMRGMPLIGIVRPVKYADEVPVVNPIKLQADLGFTVLFRKALHWAYETEWRSMIQRTAHQHAFTPETLTGVILGCQMPEPDEMLVRSWMLARRPVPKLYRARKKRDKFGVQIVEEPPVVPST